MRILRINVNIFQSQLALNDEFTTSPNVMDLRWGWGVYCIGFEDFNFYLKHP